MQPFASRAGRWPLAFTFAALGALGACSDEPAAPTPASTLAAKVSPVANEFVEVTVTDAQGDTHEGTLRWAVAQIGPAGGAIDFAPNLDGGFIILNGTLAPAGPMFIAGPAKGITITGNGQHRVITAGDDAHVSLTNVTITKGYAADYGSAISASSLSLTNSTVQDSRGPGSAIRVKNFLHATNSTISNNAVGGPALEYSEKAKVSLINTTVAYNAPGLGIGLYGPITSGYSLLVVLNNSIISNNGSPLRNCLSTSGLRYEGRNIANDSSCGEVGIGIGDPQLLPLAYNGALMTMTHAIPHTSPAFNGGLNCLVSTDQRYVQRDAKCDIGAFEFNDFTKVTIMIDPTVKLDAATGQALLSGTIECTRDDYFQLALELHQDQKVGKRVVDVHSADDLPIACPASGGTWSAHMPLAPGETFKTGAARATASTFQTPEWVTPVSVASAVKMSIARK